MAEYDGGDWIYSRLSDMTLDYIGNSRKIPESITGMDTANFYLVVPNDPRVDYWQAEWSVDCRSDDEIKAQDTAREVITRLNRNQSAVGGLEYYATCTRGGIVPPANDADCYNVPVSVILRRR